MLINFVCSMFLARLLTPAQIGVYSVAYVITGLLRTLREMGLGTYIVQETELTEARMRSAFGVSLVVSGIGGLLVMALAVPAAHFYREPGITSVLLVIGFNFFLVPFGATSMSLMRRNMRFKEIGLIETASALIGSFVAVLLAQRGMGYMSLAWSSMVGTLVSVIGVVFYRPANLPWAPALSEWRHIMKFCSYLSGSSLVSYISYSASDLVLGRLMNMSAVAYFNRAFGTASIFSSVIARAIQQVGLPFFAQLNRKGSELRPGFVSSTTMVAGLSLPFFCVLSVSAAPLINLLFGDQWHSSVPLLRILCIAFAIDSLSYLSGQILGATGNVKFQWRIDVFGVFARFGLVIPAALVGLEAVAWSFVVTSLLMSMSKFFALNRVIQLSAIDCWRFVGPALPLAAISAAAPLAVTLWAGPGMNDMLELSAIALLATSSWFAGIFAFKHPIANEVRNALALIRRR